MSVRKATKKEEEVKVEDVKVEETVDTTEEVTEVSETNEEKPEEEFEVVEEAKTDEPEVDVDTTVADVSNAPKEKNVRVKVKKDISFNFGNEKYDLKQGQCYNVPVSVKLHLNKFDVLSPL